MVGAVHGSLDVNSLTMSRDESERQGIRQSMINVLADGAQSPDVSPLRLAVALDGDPDTTNAAGTKFGLFIEALRNHAATEVVGVGDLTLSGPARAFAVAAAWQPNRRRWKEHYRKNPLTFQLRSRQSRRWLAALLDRPDLLLQVGSMSNPASRSGVPYALYLDFTFALTQREWPERAPMSRFEVPRWLRLESATYHGAAPRATHQGRCRLPCAGSRSR